MMARRQQRRFRRRAAESSDDEKEEAKPQENDDEQYFARRAARLASKQSSARVVHLGRPGSKVQNPPQSATTADYSEEALQALRQETYATSDNADNENVRIAVDDTAQDDNENDAAVVAASNARAARQLKRDVEFMSLKGSDRDVVDRTEEIAEPVVEELPEEELGWESEMLRRAGRREDAAIDESAAAASLVASMELRPAEDGTWVPSDPTLVLEAALAKLDAAVEGTQEEVADLERRLARARGELENMGESQASTARRTHAAAEKVEFFRFLEEYFDGLLEMWDEKLPTVDQNMIRAAKMWRRRGHAARRTRLDAICTDNVDFGVDIEGLAEQLSESDKSLDSEASSELSESSDEELVVPRPVSAPRKRIDLGTRRTRSETKTTGVAHRIHAQREARQLRRSLRRRYRRDTEVGDGYSTSEDEDADDLDRFEAALSHLDIDEVLDDAGEEFRKWPLVLRHFEAWRAAYPKIYLEAFGDDLVVRLAVIYGKAESVTWQWLSEPSIMSMEWISLLKDYGTGAQAEPLFRTVATTLSDTVTGAIDSMMNPLSVGRSMVVARLAKELLELDNSNSTPKVDEVLRETFVRRLTETCRYLRHTGRTSVPSGAWSRRRFWMSAKLVHCAGTMLSPWSGRASFEVLETFVLKELVNETVLLHFGNFGESGESRWRALSVVLRRCVPAGWPRADHAGWLRTRATILRLKAECPSAELEGCDEVSRRCGLECDGGG